MLTRFRLLDNLISSTMPSSWKAFAERCAGSKAGLAGGSAAGSRRSCISPTGRFRRPAGNPLAAGDGVAIRLLTPETGTLPQKQTDRTMIVTRSWTASRRGCAVGRMQKKASESGAGDESGEIDRGVDAISS
jgi:hypothetical protein